MIKNIRNEFVYLLFILSCVISFSHGMDEASDEATCKFMYWLEEYNVYQIVSFLIYSACIAGGAYYFYYDWYVKKYLQTNSPAPMQLKKPSPSPSP